LAGGTAISVGKLEGREGCQPGATFLQRAMLFLGIGTFMGSGSRAISQTNPVSRALKTRIKGVINGRQKLLLMDSGAECNIMPRQIYEELKNDLIRKPTAKFNLTTADYGSMPIIATVEAHLRLGRTRRTAIFHVTPQVLRNQCILGTEWMQDNNVTLDMGRRKVKIGAASVKINQDYSITNRLLNWQRTIVDPMTEVTIPIQLDKSQWKEGDSIFIESVDLPSGLQALDGVGLVQKGVIAFAHIANPTPNTLYVSPKNSFIIATRQEELCVQYIQTDPIEEAKVKPRQIPVRSRESDKFVRENAKIEQVPDGIKGRLLNLLQVFHDVFARNHLDVGDCPVKEHVIQLSNREQIVNIPPFRTPYHLQEPLNNYVDGLVKSKSVVPSKSCWSSPMMMVKKADADMQLPIETHYRMVHNYKRVNELIRPPSHPLPNLYGLIDEVASKKVFTVLDLSQGYFNQRLIDQEGVTAFSVPGRGTFEYRKSPMGINSSPSYFQSMMEYVLRNIKGVYVYLDDIIIATDNYEENLSILKTVLERLRRYNLKIKLKKAHFNKEEVTYLGYKISNTSISPGDRKIEAIRNFKPPTDMTKIKSFLGLCSFFRKTIPSFSEIAAPLTKLTRKSSEYKGGKLTEEGLAAFRRLQAALCQEPTLMPVDFNREFIITVDTSKIAHGAIMSQIGRDSIERVCAYASSLLPESKMRRPAIQLEKEGIRWALQHFRPYLVGKEFLIRTDHKPLVSLSKGNTDLTDNITGDIMKFQPFRVEYLPGKNMPSDCLSRPVMATFKSHAGPSKEEKAPLGTLEAGQGNLKFDTSLLRESQKADSAIKALAVYHLFKKMQMDMHHRSYVHSQKSTTRINEFNLVTDKHNRVLIPHSLREEIMIRAHDEMGHFGTPTSIANVEKYFIWETMKKDFENYIKSCNVCNQSKPPYTYNRTNLGEYPPATCFNDRIHLDCITNLRKTPAGNTAILTITDAYSGYTMAKPILSPSAEAVQQVLMNSWIATHSFPRVAVTDGGSEFANNNIRNICKFLQIEHRITPPHVSRTNGLVERKNRSIVQFLRTYIDNTKFKIWDWERLLPAFCITHNLSRNMTGFTPHFLVYGSQPVLPNFAYGPRIPRHSPDPWVDKIQTLADTSEKLREIKRKQHLDNANQFNKRVHVQILMPGDLVYMLQTSKHSPKLMRKFLGPYIVLKVTKTQALIKVLRENAQPFWCHKDRLKKGEWRMLENKEPRIKNQVESEFQDKIDKNTLCQDEFEYDDDTPDPPEGEPNDENPPYFHEQADPNEENNDENQGPVIPEPRVQDNAEPEPEIHQGEQQDETIEDEVEFHDAEEEPKERRMPESTGAIPKKKVSPLKPVKRLFKNVQPKVTPTPLNREISGRITRATSKLHPGQLLKATDLDKVARKPYTRKPAVPPDIPPRGRGGKQT
jgi:hypothetical protein